MIYFEDAKQSSLLPSLPLNSPPTTELFGFRNSRPRLIRGSECADAAESVANFNGPQQPTQR